jgi:hypothetical protein
MTYCYQGNLSYVLNEATYVSLQTLQDIMSILYVADATVVLYCVVYVKLYTRTLVSRSMSLVG